MKVILESTSKRIELRDDAGKGVPARIWEGRTESGIPVYAYITLIAVRNVGDLSEFERELTEQRAPSPDVAALPSRMVL